jgi:membrane-bound serine protease (ClpP class)
MAIGLFIAEIKVQSFGVLGVGGIVCLVIGSLILIKTEDPVMQIGTNLALGIGISFAAAFMLLLYLYMRSTKTKVAIGKESLVGQHGRVVTELSPSGKVFVQGEYWDAIADQKIEVGKEVIITAIEELCLRVKERT